MDLCHPSPSPRPRGAARSAVSALKVALLLACLSIAVPLVAPTPAGATTIDIEQDYLARINAIRASVGAPPLALESNLTGLARQHSAEMSAAGSLYHTASLSAGVVGPWTELGENVGVGGSTDAVWQAFLDSPHHHEQIVNPSYTSIGLGVTIAPSGLQWVTQRFRAGAAPAVAPDPAPAPEPAPEPEPEPAPPPPPPVTVPVTRPVPVVTVPRAVPVVPPPTPVPVPTTAAPTTTLPPPPPEPVVVPAPADPGRVMLVLDVLHGQR